MPNEKNDWLASTKPHNQTGAAAILQTLFSLLVFIGVDYLIFRSWSAVGLLVSVIVIHESGHFIAMKIFGYTGIKMTFVPFVGAYVSGEASHFSRYKRIVMLLAGPVPGIIIGMVLLYLYQQNLNQYYYLAALAFLLLNGFNLLPIIPLDGGQVVETFLIKGSLVIQVIVLLFLFIAVIYSAYVFTQGLLIIVAWFIVMQLSSLFLTWRVRKALEKNAIAYEGNYDELDEEGYAQIRDVLVAKSRRLSKRFLPGEPSEHEADLIKYIEKILVPSYQYHLSFLQKAALLSVYLSAIILPLIQWLLLKH